MLAQGPEDTYIEFLHVINFDFYFWCWVIVARL